MNMPCGNTAALNDYEIQQDRRVSEEAIEELSELKIARNKFIKELLGNGMARTNLKPYNEYFLWDAIDNIPTNHEFWMSLAMDSGRIVTINTLANDDPDFIVELFLNGRLEDFRPLIKEQVELLANTIFIGWDDEVFGDE